MREPSRRAAERWHPLQSARATPLGSSSPARKCCTWLDRVERSPSDTPRTPSGAWQAFVQARTCAPRGSQSAPSSAGALDPAIGARSGSASATRSGDCTSARPPALYRVVSYRRAVWIERTQTEVIHSTKYHSIQTIQFVPSSGGRCGACVYSPILMWTAFALETAPRHSHPLVRRKLHPVRHPKNSVGSSGTHAQGIWRTLTMGGRGSVQTSTLFTVSAPLRRAQCLPTHDEAADDAAAVQRGDPCASRSALPLPTRPRCMRPLPPARDRRRQPSIAIPRSIPSAAGTWPRSPAARNAEFRGNG